MKKYYKIVTEDSYSVIKSSINTCSKLDPLCGKRAEVISNKWAIKYQLNKVTKAPKVKETICPLFVFDSLKGAKKYKSVIIKEYGQNYLIYQCKVTNPRKTKNIVSMLDDIILNTSDDTFYKFWSGGLNTKGDTLSKHYVVCDSVKLLKLIE